MKYIKANQIAMGRVLLSEGLNQRKHNIIIKNMEKGETETDAALLDIVLNLINNEVLSNMPQRKITCNDISILHRFGKYHFIVIEMYSLSLKSMILSNAKNLGVKFNKDRKELGKREIIITGQQPLLCLSMNKVT